MFYKKIDYIQILQQNQNRGDLSIYSNVNWQFRFFFPLVIFQDHLMRGSKAKINSVKGTKMFFWKSGSKFIAIVYLEKNRYEPPCNRTNKKRLQT